MKMPIAVQLYTLREEVEQDFVGALEKVAEIGYQGVEFAGYGSLTASQLKSQLDRLGLKAAGSHVSLELLKTRLEEMMAYNAEIGNQFIVCPWAKFETRQEWEAFAGFMSQAGEKCREKGLTLCYHNHAHEFERFEGEYALDILYRNTPAETLKAEIDSFWVQRAGLDPVACICQYAGRIPLVHLKDMEPGESKDFAEVGNGIMDIRAIAAAAAEQGAKWLIVEQDVCKRPPLESVEISFNNLKKMGIV